jgi:hypothetical protein
MATTINLNIVLTKKWLALLGKDKKPKEKCTTPWSGCPQRTELVNIEAERE